MPKNYFPQKAWIAKADKYTFDKPAGNSIGTVKRGDILGYLVRKTKDKTSDAYWYEFDYKKDFTAYLPNSNGYALGRTYFLLAEPDEVYEGEIKYVGETVAKAVKATGDKAAQASKYFGIKLVEGLLIALAIFIIVEVIIKKA